MACPYFLPAEKLIDGTWPHPSRLPLGSGWRGTCTAPGHENASLCDQELQDYCNMGYPRGCAHFPPDAVADSIRFSVMRDRGDVIEICFVFERAHLPGEFGTLQYDALARSWRNTHRDYRVQRMAECYLDSYLVRRAASVAASS
jgi:hypothetical protein